MTHPRGLKENYCQVLKAHTQQDVAGIPAKHSSAGAPSSAGPTTTGERSHRHNLYAVVKPACDMYATPVQYTAPTCDGLHSASDTACVTLWAVSPDSADDRPTGCPLNHNRICTKIRLSYGNSMHHHEHRTDGGRTDETGSREGV